MERMAVVVQVIMAEMVEMVEMVEQMQLRPIIHLLYEYLVEKVKGAPLQIQQEVKVVPILLEEVAQVLEIFQTPLSPLAPPMDGLV